MLYMFYYADTADKNAILENFKARLYPAEKLNRVTNNLYRWVTFDKYNKIDIDSSIVFCDTQDDLLNNLQDNFINWVTNQALPQDKAEFIITFNAFDITDEAVAALNKSIENENINCKFYKTLGLIK